MYIYSYICDIYIYIYTFTHIYIYIYIYRNISITVRSKRYQVAGAVFNDYAVTAEGELVEEFFIVAALVTLSTAA